MRELLLIISICAVGLSAQAQKPITWQDLTDVIFTEKYMEEVDVKFLYPTFGEKVRTLEGQEVVIEGFLFIMDPEAGYYILSKNPFASCFFCGAAGPESIIELNLRSGQDKLKNDEIFKIRGKLRLNPDDIYQCNYILDNAMPVFK